MKRRAMISMSAATLAAPIIGQAQAPAVVKWWYHFDNPQAFQEVSYPQVHPSLELNPLPL